MTDDPHEGRRGQPPPGGPGRTGGRRPGTAAAAFAGVVAGGLGLAAAEVPGALSPRFRSPIFDVGDRVVDRVPAWLKNLAIELFGTHDKQVLVGSILLLLVLSAAMLGVVSISRRRLGVALAGTALFGGVGALAAMATRSGLSSAAAVPSLVGAAATGLALTVVTQAARRNVRTVADQSPVNDRRRFALAVLAVGASAAITGSISRWLISRRRVDLTDLAGGVPVASRPLPPVPASAQVPIDGVSPFFTPNRDFYRIDTALTVPRLDPLTWTLDVNGRVDRPMTLGYRDLLDRELVEADITLTCVSNEVGGRLLGTARWLGVRLDDLLADVGVDPTADQVMGRSVDGFSAGFPVAALDGRDAIIAVAMNGELLAPEHGFPARLVVPGIYGYTSATKWLREITLTRFDEAQGYWVPRGWDAEAPIKMQSRIDTPKGLAKIAPGETAIGGVAWAQPTGIARVEVRIDDGEWRRTNLADDVGDDTWRQWHHRWTATPGRHVIAVRATDKNGAIQTDRRSEPMPNGATGHHQIVVLVNET